MANLESGKNGNTRTAFNGAARTGFADVLAARAGVLLDENTAPEKPAETINVFDLGDQKSQDAAARIGMAYADSGQSLSFNAGGAAKAREADARERADKKDREEFKDRIFRDMLDRLRQRSFELGQEIENLERGFEKKFGDAWREHIANEVLDPDVVPQREDGESLADYRERLEKTLVKEMLNEDGSIKDKYKTGPYAEYAVWAEKQYDKNYVDQKMEVLSDPNVSEEVKAEVVSEIKNNGTLSQVNNARETLDANGSNPESLAAAADAKADEATNFYISPSGAASF